MKSILVPIDFSQCSKNALKAAIHIAETTGAVIELVHIYDRPVIGFVDLNIDHSKHKTLQRKMDLSMKDLIAKYDTKNVVLNTTILNDISLCGWPNHYCFSVYLFFLLVLFFLSIPIYLPCPSSYLSS